MQKNLFCLLSLLLVSEVLRASGGLWGMCSTRRGYSIAGRGESLKNTEFAMKTSEGMDLLFE